MNDVIKAMKERRSIRSFKPDMPAEADIEQILEAGLYAPSGMGKQSVITVAVTNKEIRDKLAADNCRIGGWKEGFDPFYGAPVILIVLAKKGSFTCVYDGSLVMGNLRLAVLSIVIGGVCTHGAREILEMGANKKLLADLGVEGEWEGIGHCAVGYVNGDQPEAAPRAKNRRFYVR